MVEKVSSHPKDLQGPRGEGIISEISPVRYQRLCSTGEEGSERLESTPGRDTRSDTAPRQAGKGHRTGMLGRAGLWGVGTNVLWCHQDREL